jgi:L-malate glycosyltransferase
MSVRASTRPLSEVASENLGRELDEICAIYDVLYSNHSLTFVLLQGDGPEWGAPTVIEGPTVLGPHHVSGDYLGTFRRSGPKRDRGEVTVIVSIPRAPNPGETDNLDVPWHPARPLAAVFGMAPALYEEIRYFLEMTRKTRSIKRHSHKTLPRGTGTTVLPVQNDLCLVSKDKRPAILIGFHWLEMGGAEKLGFDCVSWALEAGLRVFVVAAVPSLQRLAGRLPDHADVKFIRLDRYLPHHLWPRFVQHLAAEENIRLVHIHHCQPLYDSLPQLRVFVPWLKVLESTHIVEYANGGFPRISGVWSNFIDLHHVISGELTDYYRDRFGVVHNVRLGRMLDRHDDVRNLPSANLQSGQKKLHIAFVGRLYYQKRPVVMALTLRALDRWARANNIELTATIVGDGPFAPAIHRLLARYRLTERVEMMPGNTDVPALLERSDVLLLPSNNEGLALVCYEAIERGCIPITTDVGSQGEIVPQDLLVPLAPHRTVRETVRIVERLWKDESFLEKQQDAMRAAWARIAADPTAKEVLMPIYENAAQGAEDCK